MNSIILQIADITGISVLLLWHDEVSPQKYHTCDYKSITFASYSYALSELCCFSTIQMNLKKKKNWSCWTLLPLYMFEVCICLLALLLFKSLFPSLYIALANMLNKKVGVGACRKGRDSTVWLCTQFNRTFKIDSRWNKALMEGWVGEKKWILLPRPWEAINA